MTSWTVIIREAQKLGIELNGLPGVEFQYSTDLNGSTILVDGIPVWKAYDVNFQDIIGPWTQDINDYLDHIDVACLAEHTRRDDYEKQQIALADEAVRLILIEKYNAIKSNEYN